MNEWLLEHLACPRCYDNLKLNQDFLTCSLGHRYPYVDGIPVMLLEEAEPTLGVFDQTFSKVAEYKSGLRSRHEIYNYRGIDSFVNGVIRDTNGFMYQSLINKLTRYPIPHFPLPSVPGRHLLDLGCNWGRWSLSAAKKGYSVIGIDPSLEAIYAAKRVAKQLNVKVEYCVADARYLPFFSGSFEYVFSNSVLQHFNDHNMLVTLKEIDRILIENGISFIQLASSFGLRNFYNRLKRGFRKPIAFNVRYRNPFKLKNIFYIIGPTVIFADSYLSLNAQKADIDLLPLRFKLVVFISESLRMASQKLFFLKFLADSLYMESVKTRRNKHLLQDTKTML